MKEDSLIVKRTFEDTLNFQEELRTTLEDLIKENRCLNKEERGVFIRQLSHATFGLGVQKEVKIFLDHLYAVGSVEFFARWLARQTSKTIVIKRDGYPPSPPFEIRLAWDKLLDMLFTVFPLALDRASAMSKEYDSSLSGDAYEFKPK